MLKKSLKPTSDIPVWAIVLGFIVCWPVGLVLLFLSMGRAKRLSPSGMQDQGDIYAPGENPAARNDAGGENRAAADRSVPFTGDLPAPGSRYAAGYTRPAAPARDAQNTVPQKHRLFKKPRSGKITTVLGGLTTLVFGVTLADDLSYALRRGLSGLLQNRGDWFTTFGILCAGLFLLFRGISTSRLSRRTILYQNVIGQKNSIFLSDLASTTGVKEEKILADFERMFANGTLPKGYVDRGSGRLILLDMDPAPEEAPPERQPRGAEVRGAEVRKEKIKKEGKEEDSDSALLHEIQDVNDAIPDPIMSAKIDRIEAITRKILAYQKKNPQKSDQLHQFLGYYLPTTLKILNAYAQMDAQGVEGQNISAAKKRIESMMDKVVEGFEKQLDQLFESDAMDITTDVEVLERMLDRDGLGSGLTLGGF